MLKFISGGRKDARMVSSWETSSWERRTSQESLSGKRGSFQEAEKDARVHSGKGDDTGIP